MVIRRILLATLRAQDRAQALDVLEGHLDGALMSHGLHVLAGPPKFELRTLEPIEGFELLGPAAEYRTEHPSISGRPEIRATIAGVSACLSEASLGDPEESVREALRACYRESW